MNSGIIERGNEISWLLMDPMRRFASGIVSRIVHISCACALDCAMMPSLTSPASFPNSNNRSRASDADCAPPIPSSIKTIHSGLSSMTWRTSGMVSDKKSKPILDINSKADTASPTSSRVIASSDKAALGSRTVNRATPTSLGRGANFNEAPVMMPNVPSDPIIRWRRS